MLLIFSSTKKVDDCSVFFWSDCPILTESKDILSLDSSWSFDDTDEIAQLEELWLSPGVFAPVFTEHKEHREYVWPPPGLDRGGKVNPKFWCSDSAPRCGLTNRGTNSPRADSEDTGSPEQRTVCTAGISGLHAVQHQDAWSGIHTYRFRLNHPARRSRIQR